MAPKMKPTPSLQTQKRELAHQSENFQSNNAAPRFMHPKIMLIDLEIETEEALSRKGYNVTSDTFGIPYKVQRSSGLYHIDIHQITDHEEQEILVMDLQGLPPAKLGDVQHEAIGEGVEGIWASCEKGIIDPRPFSMLRIDNAIERILDHQGILIAFADQSVTYKYVLGKNNHRGLSISQELTLSNWSLDIFSQVEVSPICGQQMELAISSSSLARLLDAHLRESSYTCKIDISREHEVLVKNKYGDAVSTVFSTASGALVFLFPRIKRQSEFVCSFVSEVLPDIVPNLFPETNRNSWISQFPYELPVNMKLKSEIDEIKKQAKLDIEKREADIQANLEKSKFLYDLLIQSGEELVEAVKVTLAHLGFAKVIDADKELLARNEQGLKREDLWIEGRSPTLLVEVKGINGYPSETEVMQIHKYVAPRMRLWARTDVQGLAIYNHQRPLPPLARENNNTFTKDSLINANTYSFGPMTAWDLHRLARSYQKNKWRHENIADIFYMIGRIVPIPSHYESIGIIEKSYPSSQAISIILHDAPNVRIKVGDRIAFELPVEFEEQTVESLRLDNKPVTEAYGGQIPGIRTHLSKDLAKPGIRVFKIKSQL